MKVPTLSIRSSAIAAILSLCAGCEYSSSVELRRPPQIPNDTQSAAELDEAADQRVAPVVRINEPHDGEVIYDDVYHSMSWVAFDVPRSKCFVVFASDNYNYFMMYPFPRRGRTTDSFEQKNIRLATAGDEWQLHVCLATNSAIANLSSCARRGQWDFADLPEGVQVIESVRISREK